ncbi:S-layer homology domain-containing protein [Paenibacillus hexagrammi]|uniref:S-layer homology domain-containing protein n=1 Tax=Paenibacillus hexagrammi TaxID=2908839 RepID=A0ABY3SGE2_9BACL|nr:S-layer homology domain-containing protein [Paenibacillus sp. YPD9-1]UJF32007.1 S-layer homology domain-containing protein [Paenibacillus sp. YPD9-1]
MKDKGLVEGIGNLYEPNRALTRAEFVTIMDRAFDFSKLLQACSSTVSVTSSVYGCKPATSGTRTSQAASYKDLPATHWASTTMRKAAQLGLLQGYSDGTIGPDKPISRAEVAVLFNRLLQVGKSASITKAVITPSFSDVPASLWSADAIYSLKKQGIINGVTDRDFKPDLPISRAETAVMMDRYFSTLSAK